MAVAKVERRLLAVLAADVVGYTRLMEADEARTIARLKAVRAEVAGPLVVQHHGRLVNFVGDSALAAFESVVDAVSCAVDIQRVVAERNAGLPEAERLLFRVGVTLADVALLDGEVYGDGVNLAARLGQLCEPGGVVVSGTAYDHLQGKLDGLPLDFAGEHRVKNVARPVRVYRVRLHGRPAGRHLPRGLWRHGAVAALPAAALAVGLWWRWTPAAPPPADKPSVAVLPFENLSGDPAQAYLGEGFADDVITELARSRELTVLARDTSFSLKGRSEGADAAARAFGVRYLLGGSLRRTGESLRLTAWLEDTASGHQVWAERYDIGAPALVATQDDIAHRVAATLSSEVREAEKAGSLRRTPGSLDVYELALRGLALKHEFTADSFRAGRAVLRRAIQLDPDYAPAYVYLGYLDAIDGIADYTGERRRVPPAVGGTPDWSLRGQGRG